MAKDQGAEIINFNEVDPVKELKNLTNNKGPTKIIDAVGIDANHPDSGVLSWFQNAILIKEFEKEVKKIAPKTNPQGENWHPGNALSQIFRWSGGSYRKNRNIFDHQRLLKIMNVFPIGAAMEKNLTITMGNCNHRKYIPMLLEWVEKGQIELERFITQKLPFTEIVDAYKHFDLRDDNWIKVALAV